MAAQTVDAIVAHIEAAAQSGAKGAFIAAYTGSYGPNGLGADFLEFYGYVDTVNGGSPLVVSAAETKMPSVSASDVHVERDADGTVNVEFVSGGVHYVASQSPAGVVSIGESGGAMSVCAPGSSLSVSGV